MGPFITTVVGAIVAVASILGMTYGCVEAVQWGVAVFGLVPVLIAAAFVLGWILCLATMRSTRRGREGAGPGAA